MNKFTILLLAFIVILITGVLHAWTAQAHPNQSKSIDPEEKDQITKVVRAYFEARYRSFSALKMESFEGLIDESSKGNSFKRSELDKLDIELNHARFYHLRYLQYEYFLDFKDISLDSLHEMATVSVVEGHDVEFEISKEISKAGPIISKMRNLQHSIVLRKENGAWKIVTDNYEDYLWRLMKATGLSKKDLDQPDEKFGSDIAGNEGAMTKISTCNLPADQSTYPYNRNGAVGYAHQYATSPNPKYYYFPDPWGDCTNFVNQAMYEGGGALMIGSGTYGWYYHNRSDKSASWTDVGKLFEFITQYWVWPAGPEGCDTVIDQAEKGDVIQYNWKQNQQGTPDPNDQVWDHSAMIVLSQYNPTFHWVAGHTPEVDSYPYTNFKYIHPNMITRFIHIVRLDGSKLYLPLVRKSVSGMASQMQIPALSSYPGPLEAGAQSNPSPYPAP